MAKSESAEDLRALPVEELQEKVKGLKEELFNLRFQAATGQIESHGRLGAVRKEIARIYTILRERELGIRATPAPIEAPSKKSAKKSKEEAAEASTNEETN